MSDLTFTSILPVQLFLLANVFFLALITVNPLEARRISRSKLWDDLITGNFIYMAKTMVVATFLYGLYSIHKSITLLIIIFYSTVVALNFFVQYTLVKPLIKKVSFMRKRYLVLYLLPLVVCWIYLTKAIPLVTLPEFKNYFIMGVMALFYIPLISYAIYYFSILWRAYAKIGFITKPALVAAICFFFAFIYFAFLFYISNPPSDYYLLFAWIVLNFFVLSCYFRFAVEYPSLLQPKWKAYMPFDPVKITAALTMAFLAISIYFTAMEHGTPQFLSMLRSAFFPLLVPLAAIFTEVGIILTFLKSIASGTALKYWHFLKSGLYVHVAVTLYVFCLMFLFWNSIPAYERLLFVTFVVATFAFYLFYALDLKTLLSYQGIKPAFSKLDITRYFVCLYSLFFIILFSLNFTYGRTSLYINLESRPAILFFILFFMTSFGSYLSMSHKGYEEVLRKNIWSELSYISAFGAAMTVYVIYSSVAAMRDFPLRDLFFVGYFIVLLTEIVSTAALSRAYKRYEERAGVKDIVELLNRYALTFLRVDYLESIWERVAEKYLSPDKLRHARFDASSRMFHLDLDEKTRTTVAVAMLLEMFRNPPPRATTEEIPLESVKAEIRRVLKERVLMLPEELCHELGEPSEYYSCLYLKTLQDLAKQLKVFIPEFQLSAFFERLANVNSAFKEVSIEGEYDGSSYELPKGLRFQRDDFLRYFKLFVRAVEERFPFRYSLLYDAVKQKVQEELHLYGFTLGELLDVVPTGIDEIDNVLGGLVRSKATLLLTEDSKAKDRTLVAFSAQGLKDGDAVIIASSKRASEEVLDDLKMRLDAALEDMAVTIIDLYRAIHTDEQPSSLIEKEFGLIVPLNKTLIQHSIVKSIKAHPREHHKRLVLDIYDDLLRYYGFDELFNILVKQLDGFKRWSCTTFMTLSRKSLSVTELERLEKIFDNVFVLYGRDVDAKLLIEKLYGGMPSGVREIALA